MIYTTGCPRKKCVLEIFCGADRLNPCTPTGYKIHMKVSVFTFVSRRARPSSGLQSSQLLISKTHFFLGHPVFAFTHFIVVRINTALKLERGSFGVEYSDHRHGGQGSET